MTLRRGVTVVLVSMYAMLGCCGCSGSSVSGTSTSPTSTTPRYQQNIAAASAWLATQTLSDGAIQYSSTKIDPYFSNLAATGWLADSSKISAVEAWMQWYIAHLNAPDYNGLDGTIYTYTVSNGVEAPTGTYDSADSYAATFLSLAEALWNTGDSGAQTFIKGLGKQDFVRIANVITSLQQANGLVYSKPDYKIEYLMDNAENYRGLADFALLLTQAWGDADLSAKYSASALAIQSGIQNVLYIPSQGLYYLYAGGAAPNMSTWYPDAVGQLLPLVNGVISSTSTQAQSVYAKFNSAWPGWTKLSYNSQDAYPWCVTGYASYLMQDTTRTNAYLIAIQDKYEAASPKFAWPFYSAEAGWFIRANAGMSALQ
jgi:hypothetical protein